ncbi:hypothetical protein VTN02DRAFT_2264 [Thermoascus thermophilus]
MWVDQPPAILLHFNLHSSSSSSLRKMSCLVGPASLALAHWAAQAFRSRVRTSRFAAEASGPVGCLIARGAFMGRDPPYGELYPSLF